MDTAENKKVNLDDLSKEELVKKCKILITLAQKAKSTKETLQEENNSLKKQLNQSQRNDATNEILERLTDEKLLLVTQIEDLKLKNKKCEAKIKLYEEESSAARDKISQLETENTSYTRQVRRLTDENEQLINDLSTLEAQIAELHKLGIHQKSQLLELEKSNGDSLKELQCKLSISLEEVKKLNDSLKSKEKEILELSQELQAVKIIKSTSLRDSNRNCDNYVKEINELKVKNESYSNELINIQNINEKLKDKVTLYHSKLKKFALTTKEIKEEKNQVIKIFKEYTEQIKEWKEQLLNASKQLVKLVNNLENENKLLRHEREVQNKIQSNSNENSEMQEKLELCESELKSLKDQENEILRKHSIEIEKLNEALLTYKSQVDMLNEELISKTKLVEDVAESKRNIENENKNINDNLFTCQEKLDSMVQQLILKEETLREHMAKYEDLSKSLTESKEEIERLNESLKQSEDNHSVEIEKLNKILLNCREEVNMLNEELISKQKVVEEALESQRSAENQNQILNVTLLNYQEKLDSIGQELSECKNTYENENQNLNKTLLATKEENNKLNEALKQSMDTEKKLAERSSEEILRLAQSNKELEEKYSQVQDELDLIKNKVYIHNFTQTTEEIMISQNSVEENGIDLKRENAELLLEMNQMNQALKERGEIISKLEAHCEEIKKKLQLYETQANKNIDSISEKEETIKVLSRELDTLRNGNISANFTDETSKDIEIANLRSEIEALRERCNSAMDVSYAESETMSTSTISRSEEVNRLKELEGSWEERYGKLRTLAVKLKAKIKQQARTITDLEKEKEELQKKHSNHLKTIQNLHTQIDNLQDDLEKVNAENKQYLNKLNSVAENILKDKQLLVLNEETVSKLNKEIEKLNSEKQSVDSWKKQVGAKVQTLRKELEAKNLLLKESENKISKLETEIESKVNQLKGEQESHKQTKSLLDQTSSECKKNSVLNLEMQDYERSVKELSQKIEKQKSEISNLQTQFDMQKNTINALREQNKILEERIQEEEKNGNSSSLEVSACKKNIANLEDLLKQKEDKLLDVTKLLESTRSENEELSTELSIVIAEHQKSLNLVKAERDQLRNQIMSLQQNLRGTQDVLKLRDDELNGIKEDYETYKVRAQSVLKKNQNRDLGVEEKLSEELSTVRAQNTELITELKDIRVKLEKEENNSEKLRRERDMLMKKSKELENEVEELKNYSEQLGAKHQKAISEHAETVRNLKVHAETLSQCYRHQLSEQEVRHNREIIELQSRLDKAPSPVETVPVHPSMPREEGEGSESIESNPPPNTVHPIPLERLLDSKTDDEVARLKKLLFEQESKVTHLTALLSDTEQDLAKHAQMNKVLKEEIRRQQRSVEREKHAENLEYLKNVVFKFVTLHSGDERTRLVPVLNTILKLSPEETQKLAMVAKGDPGIKGWSSYLPMWPSPSKPQ